MGIAGDSKHHMGAANNSMSRMATDILERAKTGPDLGRGLDLEHFSTS